MAVADADADAVQAWWFPRMVVQHVYRTLAAVCAVVLILTAVPIALGMQYVSNPELAVTETLSKLSHDSDADVAMSAMLALGLVGGWPTSAM